MYNANREFMSKFELNIPDRKRLLIHKIIVVRRLKIDNDYYRVVPRDLFNESKLLFNIGRLALLLHKEQGPPGLKIEESGERFNIGLIDEGSLTITNWNFTIGEYDLLFKTTYNSKERFPLHCQFHNIEYPVFDQDGSLTKEFQRLCSILHRLSERSHRTIDQKEYDRNDQNNRNASNQKKKHNRPGK